MMSKAMHDGLSKQINLELFSWYTYEAMAAHFEHNNIKGCATWMRTQADEELAHAKRIINYLHDRGAEVTFTAIEQPTTSWSVPLDVFTAALEHERKVTAAINELSSLAMQEKDHASHAFLEWFVTEQVEEEAVVEDLIAQLKQVKDSPGAFFLLDRELGARTPATAGGGN